MRIEPKGVLAEWLKKAGLDLCLVGFEVDDNRLEMFRKEAQGPEFGHLSEEEREAWAVYSALTHPGWKAKTDKSAPGAAAADVSASRAPIIVATPAPSLEPIRDAIVTALAATTKHTEVIAEAFRAEVAGWRGELRERLEDQAAQAEAKRLEMVDQLADHIVKLEIRATESERRQRKTTILCWLVVIVLLLFGAKLAHGQGPGQSPLILRGQNQGSTLFTRQSGLVQINCGANLTCTWSNNIFNLAAGGGGSTAWSSLTAPTVNLSLSHGAYTTTFTWGAATGAGVNLFTLQDSASNTGTGYLFNLLTASGSALLPFRVTAQGSANGVQMTTAGVLQAIGSGQILATNAITTLNGLTPATQTFATGTTGTDFNIASAGFVHTFHLPTASASVTGKLSSTDWSTFNGKLGSSAHNVSTALTCAAASGSGTAYTCSTSPTFTPAANDAVWFVADVANTGSATLAVNGATAATTKKQGGAANLVANDLQASHRVMMTFDGTNWQMQGQLGNAPAAGATWGTNITYQPQYVTAEQYGAVGDGSTDDTTAIQNAITAIAGTGKTLILSKTYKTTTTITTSSGNFTIRGGGSVKLYAASGTLQVFGFAGTAGTGYTNTTSLPLAGRATQSTSSLVLSSASGLAVGNYVLLSYNDGTYIFSQVTRIASIVTNTITLVDPVYIPMLTTGTNVTAENMLERVVIQDLTLDGVNAVSGVTSAQGIKITNCAYCLIDNVRLKDFQLDAAIYLQTGYANQLQNIWTVNGGSSTTQLAEIDLDDQSGLQAANIYQRPKGFGFRIMEGTAMQASNLQVSGGVGRMFKMVGHTHGVFQCIIASNSTGTSATGVSLQGGSFNNFFANITAINNVGGDGGLHFAGQDLENNVVHGLTAIGNGTNHDIANGSASDFGNSIYNAFVGSPLIQSVNYVSYANPVRFRGGLTSAQSLTNGVWTSIGMTTEDFDNNNIHDNVTNNTRMNVPAGRPGFYRVNASVCFDANATGIRALAIYENGSTFLDITKLSASSSDTTCLRVSGLLYLAGGDYIEVQADQTSAGNLNVNTNTYISMAQE